MTRYCDRDTCGHSEDDHLPASQGGCFGRSPGTGHRCLCGEFRPVPANIAEALATAQRPPSVPPLALVTEPLRLGKHGDPHRAHHPACKKPDEHEGSCIDMPVADRAEALERAAACRRTAPDLERPQQHTITEPGAKLFVAGKAREMAELHAAANTIIAETNSEDLATGAFTMRATIRKQANEIVKLRAELEAERKKAPTITCNAQIVVDGMIAIDAQKLSDLLVEDMKRTILSAAAASISG